MATETRDTRLRPRSRVELQPGISSAVSEFWSGRSGPVISNHFRGLRRELFTRLQPVMARGQTPLVLLTSALPGDGKTFVSMALARTFANAPDVTVTLLDLDLVRRTSSFIFAADGRPGVMDCLRGTARLEDVVLATDASRLNFVPAGTSEENSSELLAGDALGALLDQLHRLGPGNICLIDAPPVLPVVETALFAAKVDLVLLVVRAGVTPQPAVIDAIGRLGPAALPSIVLNSVVQSHTGEYYDYSGYGAAPAVKHS